MCVRINIVNALESGWEQSLFMLKACRSFNLVFNIVDIELKFKKMRDYFGWSFYCYLLPSAKLFVALFSEIGCANNFTCDVIYKKKSFPSAFGAEQSLYVNV